ncbi:PP2C family serine/threonine-protein phosphatase [Streptomyces sp. NPDC006430]|uniref:PP2C family serine/threonine-protein phosphatase n=1 Tax=Streptomyces sp. NPDC006430 TaxID=3154299 RepID=UPI0033AF090C
MPLWVTFRESVQGVNKARNQDYCEVVGLGTAEDPLIMVVADGHGSAVHARSHLGSRFAVDLFVEEARRFGALAQPRGEERSPSLAWLMHYAEHAFPRQLVSGWRKTVLGNWERTNCQAEPAPSEQAKLLLYGSTLVGAVLTPRVFAAWQLGDGELTVVGDDGRVTVPLAPAEADLGDETESLCSPEAWLRIRTYWAPVTAPWRSPRLVAVSTDGLSKSFASDRGFLQFMAGLDDRLSAEGAATVRAVLPEWLTKASQHSGDDTTLVAAWHAEGTEATGPDRPGAPTGTCGPGGPGGPGDPTRPGAPDTPGDPTGPGAPTGTTFTDAAPPTDPHGRDE